MTTTEPRVITYDPFEPMPKAWMGFRADRVQGGFTVACCAWCEDKAKAEALAARYELRVTHGICPRCYASQTARQTGDRT